MRRGGIVGFQEGGIADELTYGDQDDPSGWQRAGGIGLNFLTGAGSLEELGDQSRWETAGNLALAGSMLVPGLGWGVGGAARAIPWAGRAMKGLWGLRTPTRVGQAVKAGAAGESLIGRGLARLLGGKSNVSALRGPGPRGFTMPGHTGFTRRTLVDRALRRPGSEIGFSALGRRALLRATVGGLAASSLLGRMSDEEIDALSDEEVEVELRRRGIPSGEGTGAGRSPSQDIFDQIETYRTAAGIPTEAEKNQNKLDEDRAKELGGYKAGIAGLRPTEEQYRLRNRSVGFGALAKLLARTGGPDDIEPGGVGAAIRGETERQLVERLGFEDKLAGIDTDIYGVESGSAGRQALLSRAGQAYDMPTLELMMQERRDAAAHRRAVEVANIQAGGRNQAMIARLYEALFSGVLSEEEEEMYRREIEKLGGGGSGEVDEILRLMGQAQGAE